MICINSLNIRNEIWRRSFTLTMNDSYNPLIIPGPSTLNHLKSFLGLFRWHSSGFWPYKKKPNCQNREFHIKHFYTRSIKTNSNEETKKNKNNNRNPRNTCEICSKLTIKIPTTMPVVPLSEADLGLLQHPRWIALW